MAERTVVWTVTASKQRREILVYWTKRNGSSSFSEKLIKLIASRIEIILKNPEVFKLTSFEEVRVASMGHYSIFYKTTVGQLIVMAFWDNRQSPEKLLEIIN